LLVGKPRSAIDETWLAATSLATWAEATHAPLAEYLLGKNLSLHGDWAEAAGVLDRALDEVAPTPRIGRELLRTRAICACAQQDDAGIARVRGLLDGDGSPFADGPDARREWVVALMARCDPGLAPAAGQAP
jgi:hypothetical protein